MSAQSPWQSSTTFASRPLVSLDMRDHDFVRDPYAAYREMRLKNDVHWCNFTGTKTPQHSRWIVVGYSTTETLLRDARFVGTLDTKPSSNVEEGTVWSPFYREFQRLFLPHVEGERHKLIRSAMSPDFIPAAIRAMVPLIERFTDEALDHALSRGDSFDLVKEIAHPIPFKVITSMLGLPTESLERIERITRDLVRADTVLVDAQRIRVATTAARDFVSFVEEKRSTLSENSIVRRLQERAGLGPMSEQDFVANVAFLITAGHETTTNFISNLVNALYAHPQVLRELTQTFRKAPETRLMLAADEGLRFDSPVQMVFRRAAVPVELSGVRIEKDEIVMLCLGAANRDPNAFSNPDLFELDKATAPHARYGVTFGAGPHVCVGLGLARVEGATVLKKLLPILNDFAIDANEPPTRHFDVTFRGFDRLVLRRRK